MGKVKKNSSICHSQQGQLQFNKHQLHTHFTQMNVNQPEASLQLRLFTEKPQLPLPKTNFLHLNCQI